MNRRKRKPVPIPNAEALAAGLREEGYIAEAVKAWGDANIPAAVERGRTIGRLEGIADAFDASTGGWTAISAESCAFLVPILRAEVARLRSGKP